MRLNTAIVAAAMGVAVALPAIAAERAEQVEGIISYRTKDAGAPTAIAKDTALVRIFQDGKIESVAAQSSSPINGSMQTCVGSAVVQNNALISGEGTCDTVDAQGDIWWLRWSAGPTTSLWTVVGGTGKYAGLKGAGTTSYVADNMQTVQASAFRQRFQGVLIFAK